MKVYVVAYGAVDGGGVVCVYRNEVDAKTHVNQLNMTVHPEMLTYELEGYYVQECDVLERFEPQ